MTTRSNKIFAFNLSKTFNMSLMYILNNDLLLRKIFDILSIDDLVKLARASKVLNYKVNKYMCIRQTFDFSNCKTMLIEPLKDGLQFLVFRSSSIRELNFENCGKFLCDAFLIPLIQHNRLLVKLSLRNCRNKLMSDLSLLVIAQTCKNLEELNLDDCSWFTANAFSFLGKNCHSLKTLSLKSCSSVDDVSLVEVLRNNSRLKALYLRHCRQIDSKVLETLSEYCKDLRILDFSRCSYISDITALKLVSGCKYLEDLNLTWTVLSTWSLRLFCDAYGNGIRSFSVAATETDDAIITQVAVANNNKLRIVDLSFCQGVTDRGLKAFTEHCQSLRILNLTACQKVSNKGIEAVGYNCHELTELTLEHCSFINSDSLLLIANKCKQLRKVNLNGCWQIRDKALVALIKRNSGLQSLSISGCKRVTASTIKNLGNSCKGLTELNISSCCSVNDKGLRHLSLCNNIVFIDMDYCRALSAGTLANMGSKWRKVQQLSLSGCNRINTRSLITVVVNNPKLEYIDITSCFSNAQMILALVKIFNKHVFVDIEAF